ncbi:MAG: hypothetical protein H6745_16460 [Deltaproteobacteria bacterium]|nr:hypothetical protein [Deltaproteobacteria bacterium]
MAPTCSDSARNQGESDVDCGGPCDPCALGATCGGSADCATGLCADGLCANAAPTCENALRDGEDRRGLRRRGVRPL